MPHESPQEIWATVLGELQINVSPANFNTWLKDTRGLTFQGNTLLVGAPSAFATEWLSKRLSPLLKKTVARVLGAPVEVTFSVLDANGEIAAPSPTLLPFEDGGSAPIDRPGSKEPGAHLNPKYTFSTFIVGGSNQLAFAASVAAAESPGRSYNPLFLYGGVGLGKTHLLQAIAHSCAAQGRLCLYTTSEQFTNEFVNALRERRTEEFRTKYRKVDVLLIDDIQFIADKEQTQETFFHTFNDLHTSNRQIILSSDRPPRSMPLLEDRLRSRFEWGLIADIQPPDIEIRLAILRSKADETGYPFPDDVVQFIAQRFQSNIRELEGALNRVAAYCQLKGVKPSLDMATIALAEFLHKNGAHTPGVASVISSVARYYEVQIDELEGPRRTKKVALARQTAMYILREQSRLSFLDIGRALGNRDHTTILHGYQKIAQMLDQDASLRRAVAEITAELHP